MLIGLSLLFLTGLVFGELAKKIGLPHFIGIIVAGILVKSFLPQDFYDIASDLKRIALVVLMTRVSFNLKVNEIVEIGPKSIFVSIVPPLTELFGTALVFYFLLDYSVTSALVLGSILAASSPAISVPLMMKVKKEGYGVKKRIPQMLVASGGVDNAFILVLFYALLDFDTRGGFQLSGLLNVPLAFLIGAVVGFCMYYVIVFILSTFKFNGVLRTIITLSTSFFLLGLEDVTRGHFAYSGIIAILTVGILLLYNKEELAHELAISYRNIWSFVEILLFGILGTSISFAAHGKYLVLGISISIVAMGLRMLGVFIALISTKLNTKEKIFCGITLSAKASVQASLGGIPIALGLPYGEMILAVSVISIFVTSPASAILIEKTYKKFLVQDEI